MFYKALGKTEVKLSEIGIGTWQLNTRTDDALKAIRVGLDNGINFVDTAEVYGTEELVGEAIRGYKDVFVATKVWPTHFHYNDVIKSCEQSLSKLGISQIGLYQLHWPNPAIPISETMSAMEKLVDMGKIRYIGVSNFSMEELIAAQKAMSKYTIVSNQVEYSLLVRDAEKELLPFCHKTGITLIAYSPLARGALFSGRYRNLSSELSSIAQKYKKTAVQTALNWLLGKGPVIAIPKANNPAHMLENIAASSWRLASEDVDAINRLVKDRNRLSMSKKVRGLLSIYFKLRR